MLGKVGMGAPSLKHQPKYSYPQPTEGSASPGLPKQGCDVRRMKFLVVVGNREIPGTARSLGRRKEGMKQTSEGV